MDLAEVLKSNDYRVLLVLGAAVWFVLSSGAIAFGIRVWTGRMKDEKEFKKELQENTIKTKDDIHDIRNFMMKYEGTIKTLTRDSEESRKEINKHAHAITAIRTTLHNRGIMKFDFIEGGER